MNETENMTFRDIGKMTLLMFTSSGRGLSLGINGTCFQKSEKIENV